MRARPAARTHPAVGAAPPHEADPADDQVPAAGGLAALLESVAEEILAVTYWFDPLPHPAPYPVTVRFAGRRVDVEGPLQPGDRFVQEETIAAVVPGSGPVALTARVRGVNPGAWAVTAQIQGAGRPTHARRKRRDAAEASPAAGLVVSRYPLLVRLWHAWASATGPSVDTAEPVHTCLIPFARVPGIVPVIWAVMLALGILVALVAQAVVLAHDHLVAGPVLITTIASIAVGAAGARLWFVVKHRRERQYAGWCIQGFITGASLAAVLLFTALRMPTGTVLDVTAPGLLFAMAVGRVGCFLAGCCGGPPTASRWGVWSSDQRVGARRVPTQLMESGVALILGIVVLVGVVGRGPAGGAYFVAALAAYTLARQGILRLRAEPVTTRLGVPVVAVVSALALAGAIVAVVVLAR